MFLIQRFAIVWAVISAPADQPPVYFSFFCKQEKKWKWNKLAPGATKRVQLRKSLGPEGHLKSFPRSRPQFKITIKLEEISSKPRGQVSRYGNVEITRTRVQN